MVEFEVTFLDETLVTFQELMIRFPRLPTGSKVADPRRNGVTDTTLSLRFTWGLRLFVRAILPWREEIPVYNLFEQLNY